MKINTLSFSLWIATMALFAGRPALAQDPVALMFTESASPAGVIRGYVKAGDRWGALLAGGRTVYSNDTFTVKSRGHTCLWKVLEVSNGRARLARAESSPASPFSTPPDCKPNFGEFLALFDKGSRAYKEASTQVQKNQIMSTLRENAKQWCSQHAVLCVKGDLSDLVMQDDNNALLRLQNVDCWKFKPPRTPTLYIYPSFEVRIPISREQALSLKKGDQVILCGRPTFRSGSDTLPNIDGLAQLTCFTSFRMLPDVASIGFLSLEDVRYDIFDPKSDSVQ